MFRSPGRGTEKAAGAAGVKGGEAGVKGGEAGANGGEAGVKGGEAGANGGEAGAKGGEPRRSNPWGPEFAAEVALSASCG